MITPDDFTVHHDTVDTGSRSARVIVFRLVFDPVGVKQDQVSEITRFYQAPPCKAKNCRGQAGHTAYGLTHGEQSQFPRVMTDDTWKGAPQAWMRVLARRDTIGTDHCPFPLSQKLEHVHRFDRIPNGAPGIEDRVELIYSNGVRKNRISLNQWVRLLATHPAKIYGLYPRKGDLIPGADADIVVFNPDHRHVISAATRHMNVDYNSYAGMEVTGKVEQVFLRELM